MGFVVARNVAEVWKFFFFGISFEVANAEWFKSRKLEFSNQFDFLKTITNIIQSKIHKAITNYIHKLILNKFFDIKTAMSYEKFLKYPSSLKINS